ncbi:MAG: TonB-dependent receptor plug domain-containing protein, partial [Mangrovibacterium sp.]
MKKNIRFALKAKNACLTHKHLLMMKLTVFLLLFTVIQSLGIESYSQETKFNLNYKNSSLKEILVSIENQSEFYFLYSSKIVDVDRKINAISIHGKNILETLDEIFKDTDIFYTIKNRQILLSCENDQSIAVNSNQQQRSVSGKVTDISGLPLPGVTVVVKGTTQGTITDIDGNYALSHIPGDAILLFSFVGMKAQEISVAGKTVINIAMEEETIGLDEVVAIGYGTVRKSDLTGAVGVIKADRLDQQINTNVGSALQGKMAGVSIEASGGLPGSEMNIQIRGAGSLNNNLPLILVDNIPVTSLNNINPTDIESMEVLKDASAAAIYGSRAANGVILVTTKGGKKGPV